MSRPGGDRTATGSRDEADRSSILAELSRSNADTLMATLGIEFSRIGNGFLEATMPVEPRHHQPMGILHGGATAALAESVGSMASAVELAASGRHAVGIELAINHVASVRSGALTARAEPAHLGRSTHLWQIRIADQDRKLIALAKITLIVLAGKDG